MLVKYSGILMIFITLCMIGRYKALNVQKDLDLLRDLCSKLISSKLSLKFDRKRSLEIIKDLKKTSDLIKDSDVTKLTEDLYSKVGTTPLDGQLLLFEGCEERLKLKLDEYEKKAPVKLKLYNSLGVLAGAFFAIILI